MDGHGTENTKVLVYQVQFEMEANFVLELIYPPLRSNTKISTLPNLCITGKPRMCYTYLCSKVCLNWTILQHCTQTTKYSFHFSPKSLKILCFWRDFRGMNIDLCCHNDSSGMNPEILTVDLWCHSNSIGMSPEIGTTDLWYHSDSSVISPDVGTIDLWCHNYSTGMNPEVAAVDL